MPVPPPLRSGQRAAGGPAPGAPISPPASRPPARLQLTAPQPCNYRASRPGKIPSHPRRNLYFAAREWHTGRPARALGRQSPTSYKVADGLPFLKFPQSVTEKQAEYITATYHGDPLRPFIKISAKATGKKVRTAI